MRLVVDNQHLGTTAEAWSKAERCISAVPVVLSRPNRVVVIAPHPDDEILGAGGLLQYFDREGAEIVIVAVTDGEASHPTSKLEAALDLRSIREQESEIALRRLCISNCKIVRLRIPDGQVAVNIEGLEAELVRILGPDDFCLAPWEHDGHPDHDASGAATLNVTRTVGSDVLHYLVWALHWADPNGDDLPWHACRRQEMSVQQLRRKRRATLAFRSQIHPLGSSNAEDPILPPAVLQRHWLGHELFIDPKALPISPVKLGIEPLKERS
jgi:LmbE family N-acetylglucosaminyl deacetylase